MLHGIYGLALECDTRLPELPALAHGPAELTAILKSPAVVGRGWTWVREWTRLDGTAWLKFGRRGDEWLLRMPRLADFVVSGDAGLVRCRAAPGVPARTMRHLLIDHVVPVVLSARGHLLLHASGIRTPAGAVLFAGPSGSGKSTLAFLLGTAGFGPAASAARRAPAVARRLRPWQPLADDVVLVEIASGRPTAMPAYPGARLWPDVLAAAKSAARLPRIAHYSDKRRLPGVLERLEQNGTIISRVVLLGDAPASGDVELTVLSRQAAFVALVPHVYRLDPEDVRMARAQFDALSRFCAAVEVRSLAFPRRFDRLDAIRDVLARDLP